MNSPVLAYQFHRALRFVISCLLFQLVMEMLDKFSFKLLAFYTCFLIVALFQESAYERLVIAYYKHHGLLDV